MDGAVSAADADRDFSLLPRAALLSRPEGQPVIRAGRWTRDELYEDDR
jgi:hypothetical protein